MTPASKRLSSLSIALFALTAHVAWASDEPAVPLQLQADLTVKVVAYVQEPHLQPSEIMHIGILTKTGHPESTRFGSELKGALDRVATIAGVAHDQSLLTWAGANRLVEEAKRRHLFIIYLAPGFDSDLPAIALALRGLQVVTVAASDSYVALGSILGFELLSGHPKMVFNIGQAKKQNVVFRSVVMKLMRIVE